MLADAKNYGSDAPHPILSFASSVQSILLPCLNCNHVKLWANMNNLIIKYHQINHCKSNVKWKEETLLLQEVLEVVMFCFQTREPQPKRQRFMYDPFSSGPTCHVYHQEFSSRPTNHCEDGACCHQWTKIHFYRRQQLLPHPVMW